MISAPCKNCPDRHYVCWGTCKKYKKFKEEWERGKAVRREEVFKNLVIAESTLAVMKRNKKY